ncbi:MAG TPA: hypothetical protein VNT02_02615, partial [Burkholderiales bacterium]|nr:hypothetical protein [Burkholderiales bacterium]
GAQFRNIALINDQPLPCLVVGLCPPYVQFLPPVDSPYAPDHRWRPMWITFDAPITEFGFQEIAPRDSYTLTLIDSIRAYRAGVLVGEESFALPPGTAITPVGARFSAPFDLVLLDRQVRDPATGAGGFIDGPDFIDNVRFAPAIVASIPEPSGAILFGLGGVAWRLRPRLSRRLPRPPVMHGQCDGRSRLKALQHRVPI